MPAAIPRALLFDVFGTVVDWRGSLIREGRALGQKLGLRIDWAAFADAWRAGYKPAMDEVRRGTAPWANIDELHCRMLEDLLLRFGIGSLDDAAKDEFNRAWHRLKPWPDSVRGLKLLKRRFTIAPLSNGNVALLTDMAKNAGLPWDLILSAELFRRYKPDRETYLGASALLALAPEQVMLVAAHKDDLAAARACGLRTCFLRRPLEHGPLSKPDITPDPDCDLNVDSIVELAERIGAR
jgi:2-haloacid dehalogenase